MSSEDSPVIAVDIGTSAVRAALISASGGLLRSVRRSRSSHLGGMLFDAEALWDDVRSALRALEVSDSVIAAVSVSAHIGTVAVDESLRPVVSGGGWADVRGLDRLNGEDRSVIDRMLRCAGRPVAAGSALALALELDAQDLGARVHALLSPKDYINAKLTGLLCTDTVDAAYTLAFDIRTGKWQSDELARLGVPSSWLPEQMRPSDILAEVSPEGALACGLPARTPVIAGGPDGSVGLGLLLGSEEESIADVAGTTDVLGMLVDDVKDQPSAAILNPAFKPGRWTVGGSTGLTGGAVADWRSLVGAFDEQELEGIVAGCAGLRVLPAMSGERFPRWRPATRGAVLGRSVDHGPAHLLRAAQEAACFTVREGLDLLDPSRRRRIRIAGGSVRSHTVAQMRADVFGRRLLVASEPDVTLLGAAGLALVAVGTVDDLGEARERLGIRFNVIEPTAATSTLYDSIYADWLRARDSAAAFDVGNRSCWSDSGHRPSALLRDDPVRQPRARRGNSSTLT